MTDYDAKYSAEMAQIEQRYQESIRKIDAEYQAKIQPLKLQLANFVAIVIGGATGGTTAVYAAMGALPWWFAVFVFAWPLAAYVQAAILWGRR